MTFSFSSTRKSFFLFPDEPRDEDPALDEPGEDFLNKFQAFFDPPAL